LNAPTEGGPEVAGRLLQLDLLEVAEPVEHLLRADLAFRLEPGGRPGERLLQAPHVAPEGADGEIEVVLRGGCGERDEREDGGEVAQAHGHPVCLCGVVMLNDHFSWN
jgi:hypothetical protein